MWFRILPTSAVNIAAGRVYNPVTREVRTTYRNILAAGTSAQLSLDNKVVPCYSSVGKAWTTGLKSNRPMITIRIHPIRQWI
ncbi:MAG: hypothetical protein IPO48_05925 [Saprospiraceae bacterium]|nr:hypothetical protein [Saprospiraceae bacterium]